MCDAEPCAHVNAGAEPAPSRRGCGPRGSRSPRAWRMLLASGPCAWRAGCSSEPACRPLLALASAPGGHGVPAAHGHERRRQLHRSWSTWWCRVPPRGRPGTAARLLGAVDLAAAPAGRQRLGPRLLSVIVIHGGGFTAGSRVAFVGQFLEMLAAAGYPWMSIDYRLGGPSRAAEAADDVAGRRGVCALPRRGTGDRSRAHRAARRGCGRRARGACRGTTPCRGGRRDPDRRPLQRRAGPCARRRRRSAGRSIAPPRRGSSSCTARPTRRYRFGRPRHGARRRAGKRPLRARAGGGREPPAGELVARAVGLQGARGELVECSCPGAAPRHPSTAVRSMASRRCPQVCTSASRMRSTRTDASPRTSALRIDARRSSAPWTHGSHAIARAPRPAVVLLHGGGWEAGDRVTYITPLFAPLAEAGFAWFSVDYRLTPAVRHPRQLDDLRAAIAFIRRHARQFGIDPRRVVLVGESASAQMVTLLAADDRTLAGVVSFYGVYDFVPMVTDAGPRSLAARLFGRTVLDDETRRDAARLFAAPSGGARDAAHPADSRHRRAPLGTGCSHGRAPAARLAFPTNWCGSRAPRTGWRTGKAIPSGSSTRRAWSRGFISTQPRTRAADPPDAAGMRRASCAIVRAGLRIVQSASCMRISASCIVHRASCIVHSALCILHCALSLPPAILPACHLASPVVRS